MDSFGCLETPARFKRFFGTARRRTGSHVVGPILLVAGTAVSARVATVLSMIPRMTREALRGLVGMTVIAGALGVACSSSGGANPDAGTVSGHGGAAGIAAGGAAGTASNGSGGQGQTAGRGAGGAGGRAGGSGGGVAGTGGTGGAAGGSPAGMAGTAGTAGSSGGGLAGTGGTAGTAGGGAVGMAGGAGQNVGGAGGAAGGGGQGVGGGPTTPGDSVLMYHDHLNRDGVYVQPSLTKVAAAGLHQDSGF